MDVKLPDGTIVQGVPEGITQTELTARVERMKALKAEGVTKSSPPKFTPSGEKGTPDSIFDLRTPEMQAAFPPTRFAMGAASPFLGLYQLGANAVGQGEHINQHMKQLEALKHAGREKIGSEGFDWTEGAGAVMSPAWRALPSGAATLGGRTAQGIGTGAAAGATAPVTDGGQDFWSTKAGQTGAGAAIGGVLPAAGALLKKSGGMVYHGLVEPATEGGQTAIKGRAYLDAAGDKANEIIDLLARNRQLVPGSAPTAGEAAVPAGRAEFSALQQSAAKVKPSEYLARSDQQNAARVGAVEEFAGTPAKMAEASAAREAAAKPLYDTGTQGKMPLPSETANVTEYQQLLAKPSMQSAVKRAEKLIEEETGKSINLAAHGRTGQLTGDQAQKIKLAFDDLIRTYPKSAADTAELQAIKDSRTEYLKWVEAQFPALKEARAAYKEGSAPINQMEVGRELENKLTPALRDDAKLRSGMFANAVRDSASTIKKATGEPRFQELEDLLTNRQLQSVHGVQADLARSDRHLDMASRGAQAGPNALDLATGNLEREVGGKLPNMLHRGAMLANAIITRLEGKVNRKLASEMAMEMLDPPKVGEALAAAQARQARNKLLAEQIRLMQRPAIAGGSALAATQGE